MQPIEVKRTVSDGLYGLQNADCDLARSLRYHLIMKGAKPGCQSSCRFRNRYLAAVQLDGNRKAIRCDYYSAHIILLTSQFPFIQISGRCFVENRSQDAISQRLVTIWLSSNNDSVSRMNALENARRL